MQFQHHSRGLSIENPSECPHCHKGIEPKFIHLSVIQNDIYSIWNCTFKDCKKQFITHHLLLENFQIDFVGYLDGSPVCPYWPQYISSLNSKFIETYKQSLKAESIGLDEIAGMGFRKAIEYLVKDYLINRNPELKGSLEDKLLMAVIKENFNSTQESDLKDLLVRATWLGNDMTHYLKYHIDFNINDLKDLIQLVMDEIHSIEQKRHYIEKMQSKK
jgi:hypothetical protein